MSVHLFTGDSIYPLMNSRETTDSLHVYCTWLFRAPKRFSFEAAAAVLHVCATIKLWLEHGLAPRLNWRIYGRALHLVLISPVVKAYHVFPHLLSQANPLFHTPKLAPGGLLHHTPCFSCTAPSIRVWSSSLHTSFKVRLQKMTSKSQKYGRDYGLELFPRSLRGGHYACGDRARVKACLPASSLVWLNGNERGP